MKFLLTLLTIFLPAGLAPLRAAQPDILVLFADDQCFETIRAAGLTDIDTPNLDRLTHRGTTFTHAYNMGSWSGAVCVASRAMLMTGRTLWRANRLFKNTDAERTAGRLWPQLMARAGYRTCFTGKWHVQTEASLCFDESQHIRPGMAPDRPSGYRRPVSGQPDLWSPADPGLGGHWTGGKHWSEVTADDTIAFLAAAPAQAKPNFIYAAFNAPHDPRQAPQAFLDRYPLERIALPKNFLPDYPYKDEIGCPISLRDENLAPMPRTAFAIKTHRREYYALISYLDFQIGRILDALEKSGRADSTFIFFTADHGLACGHHGLMGKQNLYEESLRVPFIVAGPGVKAGQQIHQPIYLQDLMATALAIAGAPRPPAVEFQNLLPALRGEALPAGRDAIYAAYLDLQRAVIHDGWKLIAYPRAKVLRLFHTATDPDEMQDLASDPSQAGRRRDLFQRLLVLQKELEDPLDLAATFTP